MNKCKCDDRYIKYHNKKNNVKIGNKDEPGDKCNNFINYVRCFDLFRVISIDNNVLFSFCLPESKFNIGNRSYFYNKSTTYCCLKMYNTHAQIQCWSIHLLQIIVEQLFTQQLVNALILALRYYIAVCISHIFHISLPMNISYDNYLRIHLYAYICRHYHFCCLIFINSGECSLALSRNCRVQTHGVPLIQPCCCCSVYTQFASFVSAFESKTTKNSKVHKMVLLPDIITNFIAQNGSSDILYRPMHISTM